MAERMKIWIADTMNRLLQHKSIEDIRVTEICREAEIERPTFYYHFRDKYELMAWMFCRKALGTDILSVESAAKSMNGMRQDFIFYKRAYEDHSQNPMWSYMVEYFVERYARLAKEKLGTEALDPRLQYCIRLYCHGAVGMTREWLLKDNITPAETVVRLMFDAMPEAMRRVCFSDEDGTAWQKAKQGSQ
ncbi:MAG: TetR family transcriptional regulator [Clostridia bacterium]|nr:TetR family transcriptional regulator [Clostridia bacterium]